MDRLTRPGPGAPALVFMLTLAGCGEGAVGHVEPATAPIAVAVEPVASTAWTSAGAISATILPLRRALPGSVLLGRVDEVLHREGDAVAAGQLLARVESREVAARLAQAEAGVAAARAMAENALRMRQRMERLHARQAAARRSLDDATAAHEAAAAQLEAAEQAVAAARTVLSYSEVVAPFAGIVVDKRVEVGDTAAPGVPLFAIEDLSRVKLEAQVAESIALGLRPGAPVEVEVPAAGEGVRSERIDEVLPAADPGSRTFTVRVVLDNAGGRLRSGMYARLRPSVRELRGLSVPATALVRSGPLAGVFVVGDDGVARLRWITLGQERDGRVLVLSGLQPGESVVTRPPPALADGMRVEGT